MIFKKEKPKQLQHNDEFSMHIFPKCLVIDIEIYNKKKIHNFINKLEKKT